MLVAVYYIHNMSEQYDIETADKTVTKVALVEWLKDVFNFKFLT